MDPFTIGAIASIAGTAIPAIFGNSPEYNAPAFYDPTADIDLINQQFAQSQAGVKSSVEAGMQGMTAQTASNLANRGIYGSPVGEYGFQQDRDTKINALTRAYQDIENRRAQAVSGLIGRGVDYNQRIALAQAEGDYQNELGQMQSLNAIGGAVSGFGGAMMGYGGGGQAGIGTDSYNVTPNMVDNITQIPNTPAQVGAPYTPYNPYYGGKR